MSNARSAPGREAVTSEPGGVGVHFDVLGPLRARRGDVDVPLGSLQQRVVLAVLLLHANRPMARQQLIEAIWGWDAPTYAVNLLQKHVSGLRRAIEPDRAASGSPPLLTWTPAGYLLNLAPGRLDLDNFVRAVEIARLARANGDLPAAATSLHEGLRFWRGMACEGLSSPLLDAERDRLAERRITAIEERVDIDLALGRHFDLIAELQQLTSEHPLRERLRGLLMLALYRCGRLSEALAVFRETRKYLNEELGVEPGQQLQELHQQILSADSSLDAAPAVEVALVSGPVSEARTPAQLPHTMADFTGRTDELSELDSLLTAQAADSVLVAMIAGTPGVGKTTLAVQWAHRIKERFPDGQLYVNLRGFDPGGPAMETPDAIRGFLDAFEVPPQRIPVNLDAQAALYRSLTAGRRLLIVLDNASDADQVRPLLPGSAGSAVIVTSRNQLTGLVAAEGAHSLFVDLLTVAEARRFLKRRLGAERIEAELRAVDEIIVSCARLPLALSIVAARAAVMPKGFPLGALAAELREAQGLLDAFDGDDDATNVRAVFSWSYHRLGEHAQRLFRLLGWHPGPSISIPAAASLAGVPAPQVRRTLRQLAGAHLVEESASGRFAFHDLLRAYAAEQAQAVDSVADRHEAARRVLDHYVLTGRRAARVFNPHEADPIALETAHRNVVVQELADVESARIWFTAEHSVLLAVLRQAVMVGFDSHVCQLAWTLTPYFNNYGHWHDWADSQRHAAEAADRLADGPAMALAYRQWGRAQGRLGRYDDGIAHLRRALDGYESLGDQNGQAHAHLSLAGIFDVQGRYGEGLGFAERALQLFKSAGNQLGEGKALNAVGWFHAQLAEENLGLAFCEQALELQRATGDRYGEAETSDSLGFVHRRLGHHRESVACYRRALALYREFDDPFDEANSLSHLGDSYQSAGDHTSARENWALALTIFHQLNHPDADLVQARLLELPALIPPSAQRPS